MKKLAVFVVLFFIILQGRTSSEDAIQEYANALKAYDDAVQQLKRADLRAQKKEIIQKAVSLNSEQSKAFWPIYNKYEAENARINDTRLALITDYMSHRENLSSQKATELINDVMRVQGQRQELKKAYVKDLGKVLTAKQALRLLLLENQLDLQIDAAIAAQIPL